MKSLIEIKENICWVEYKEDEELMDTRQLQDKLLEQLDLVNPIGVILIFQNIQMLNSDGIGQLAVLARKVVHEKNYPLVLVVNHYVNKILNMTGLADIFEVADNLQEARSIILSWHEENEEQKRESGLNEADNKEAVLSNEKNDQQELSSNQENSQPSEAELSDQDNGQQSETVSHENTPEKTVNPAEENVISEEADENRKVSEESDAEAAKEKAGFTKEGE